MPSKTTDAEAVKGKRATLQEDQLDRFKQTARELGCDETGEVFEKAFAEAVPVKKRPATNEKSKD